MNISPDIDIIDIFDIFSITSVHRYCNIFVSFHPEIRRNAK